MRRDSGLWGRGVGLCRVTVALGLALLNGCVGSLGPSRTVTQPETATQPMPPPVDTGNRAQSAHDSPRTMELAVPGFEPAVVTVPPGTGPHPVLFATHGAGGSAESQCEYWLSLLERPFLIVCPRGNPLAKADPEGGYYYASHLALESEVLAIAAEVAKLPSAAAPPYAYAGYSQGATMGALMLVSHGDLFDRAALLEGGTEGWTSARAQMYRKSGGSRVLFVCGTRSCFRGAQGVERVLGTARLSVRVVHAEGAGHTEQGGVRELAVREMSWFWGGGQ